MIRVPTIHLMQGPSASGKSTYVRELIKALKALAHLAGDADYEVCYIGLDALRGVLYNTARQAYWRPGQEARTQRALAALVRQLVEDGADVVIDDTHCYPEQLEHLREALAGIPVRWEIHRMNTPLDECLRRDAGRENPVGEDCIRGLHQRQQEAEGSGWQLTPEWMTQAQTQEAAA